MSKETAALIGKRILVGLTYLDHDGKTAEQIQLHGVVAEVNEHTLRFQRADGGGLFSVPNDGSLAPADPEAVYTLRTTGEAVSGVDHVATWMIHRAPHRASDDEH